MEFLIQVSAQSSVIVKSSIDSSRLENNMELENKLHRAMCPIPHTPGVISRSLSLMITDKFREASLICKLYKTKTMDEAHLRTVIEICKGDKLEIRPMIAPVKGSGAKLRGQKRVKISECNTGLGDDRHLRNVFLEVCAQYGLTISEFRPCTHK